MRIDIEIDLKVSMTKKKNVYMCLTFPVYKEINHKETDNNELENKNKNNKDANIFKTNIQANTVVIMFTMIIITPGNTDLR